MSNFTSFLLGVASSIVSTFIIYLLRFNLGFFVNLLFLKIYPNVSGEYNYYVYRTTAVSKTEAKKCDPKDGIISGPGDKLTNKELLDWLKSKKRKTHVTIKLKQFANKISGEVYCINENKIIKLEKINGRITPSRVLVLNSESKDNEHHNFGTYLLNLTNDLSIIKGTRSGLCMECGDAASDHIILEKK